MHSKLKRREAYNRTRWQASSIHEVGGRERHPCELVEVRLDYSDCSRDSSRGCVNKWQSAGKRHNSIGNRSELKSNAGDNTWPVSERVSETALQAYTLTSLFLDQDWSLCWCVWGFFSARGIRSLRESWVRFALGKKVNSARGLSECQWIRSTVPHWLCRCFSGHCSQQVHMIKSTVSIWIFYIKPLISLQCSAIFSSMHKGS